MNSRPAAPRRLLSLCAAVLMMTGAAPALVSAKTTKPGAAKASAAKPAKAQHDAAAGSAKQATLAAEAPQSGLPATVTTALRQAHVPLSSTSFYVIKLGAPAPRASWNAQTPMNPASTMKLVTTFAGLQLLGPGYRWPTTLYAEREPDANGMLNSNVYLRGQGDPKLVPEEMSKLVIAARKTGADVINGNLVLDRTYFEDGVTGDDTIDGETTRAYNVRPDALLYSFKTMSFTLTPDAATRGVTVAMTPALAQVRLDNHLALSNGRCGDWRTSATPAIVPQADGTVLARFDGMYSTDCGEQILNMAALSHNDFIAGGFIAEWELAGGRFTHPPSVLTGAVPRNPFVLARHYSAPLSDIVRDINKYSNNVMARQLYLTLGAEIDHKPASTARSARVVRNWLARQGLDMPTLALDNGSGLSREERISAYDMARLLQQAAASDVGTALINSLPILGVDGTLRHRLTKAGAAGNGYLKTGTLNDVRALAGYVDALDGDRYVVVSYINNGNASQAQQAHDALLQWVYRGTK